MKAIEYFKQIKESNFTFVFMLLVIIFCIILGILSYFNSADVLKESIEQSLLHRTEDNADLLSRQIKDFKTIIEGVANCTEVRTMNWDIQEPVLISEAKRLGLTRFSVVDLNGLARSTTGQIVELSDREHFQKALQGVTNITDPFVGRIDNEMIFACATPIRNDREEIRSVLISGINSHFLSDMIKNIKVGESGYGFIINKDKVIVSHPDEKLVISNSRLDEMIDKNERTDIEINEMVSGKTGFVFYKSKGIENFASYTPIPNTNWILVLKVPKSEIFSELETLKFKFLIMTIISVIISIAFSLLVLGYNFKNRKISLLKNQIEEDSRLIKENAELESIRNQFFANISHEFKTPLNVILGTVQIFELYSTKESLDIIKVRKHVQVMKQNCRRLLRLINNLIDSTRIDAGFLKANLQNYNIVSIIEEITLSVAEFASTRDIELIFDTDSEEEIVACDVDKLERIILNLLSNAIKFTNPGGKIFVSIFHKGDAIILSVKDTGIGIPEDEQEAIFERFKQIEQTLSRNNEGSGIGLSLVKTFVEMHGGNIFVKSECNKGSEFIIELPIKSLADLGDLSRNNNGYLYHDRIEKINIEFSDIYPLR